MKFLPATRRDHETFCTTEGWTERKRATGRTGAHHVNYEMTLPDGRVLLTRISHPVDREDYGKGIWAHILRDQLEVDEADFWGCVNNGVTPDRGAPVIPKDAIPAGVIYQLIMTFHLSEAEVHEMTKREAIATLAELYSAQ